MQTCTYIALKVFEGGSTIMSQIKQLSNRLSVLGYSGFEISNIISAAANGQQLTKLNKEQLHSVAKELGKYVTLGSQYVAAYSK